MIGLWYNIVKRLFLQGMLAIHNSPITAHGNLRSSNCLIDSRWTCKIADFGLDSVKANQPEEDFGDYASYIGKWTTLPFESMVTEYCLDVTYSRLLWLERPVLLQNPRSSDNSIYISPRLVRGIAESLFLQATALGPKTRSFLAFSKRNERTYSTYAELRRAMVSKTQWRENCGIDLDDSRVMMTGASRLFPFESDFCWLVDGDYFYIYHNRANGIKTIYTMITSSNPCKSLTILEWGHLQISL